MAIKRINKTEQSFGSASMTDLMFLLLIFMLIATTLINPNALKVMLPKSSNQLKEKPYTTVTVTADMRYYVETEPVSFSSLEGALQAKLEGVAEPMISLHMDKSVPVDEFVKVMNIAKDNGYKLILATQP